LVSSSELERCLAEHASQRLPGISLYREILERRLGKTPPGTVFAAEVMDLLVAAGLPEDPVRSNDFALDGWLQLLVTYRRTGENPESIVAEVEAALACRGGV
jgi:hypothetical protein